MAIRELIYRYIPCVVYHLNGNAQSFPTIYNTLVPHKTKVWEFLSVKPKIGQKSWYLLATKWNWSKMDGSSTIFYLDSVDLRTSHHHLWYLGFKMSGHNGRTDWNCRIYSQICKSCCLPQTSQKSHLVRQLGL